MKRFSQKDKQVRGEKGESLITESLRLQNLWNHKFINAGFGTVFDKLVIPPGGGYALEIKVRDKPKIAYNTKSITPNERRGLDNFMNKVGRNYAFIIGIWQAEDSCRAFLIPWHEVRSAVCSGNRGSIDMLKFPEIPKKGIKLDLSCFGRRSE
jgi:hypothetical protein